jgi:hypothetical protein
MSWGRETYLLMATIVLLFLDHTTSSVVAMSPELSRIIFALTYFENFQSGWSVAKPTFDPDTCGILSRTANPLVEYSISYIYFNKMYALTLSVQCQWRTSEDSFVQQ